MTHTAILGGGAIGTALAGLCGKNGAFVTLHSSRPQAWSTAIQLINPEMGTEESIPLGHVTSDYQQAVSQADVVFITHPATMARETFSCIRPFLKPGAMVGMVPGSGGVELYARPQKDENFVFFGLDRVPCIARVHKYGHSVVFFPKNQVRLAAFPSEKTQQACEICASLMGLECVPLDSYLSITLTPSNQILHTSRLRVLFADTGLDTVFPEPILFYRSWDDASSRLLLACDQELQEICKVLEPCGIQVVPLEVHYQASTVQAMTRKIASIPSFQSITAPLVPKGDGYVMDLNSRYFTADFSYGLVLVKAFGELCQVLTPNIDEVLSWYGGLVGKPFLENHHLNLSEVSQLPIPQNFGIGSLEALFQFYGTSSRCGER